MSKKFRVYKNFTYYSIIKEAILSERGQKATSTQIFDYITNKHPHLFRQSNAMTWKGNIRQLLSKNPEFVKLQKDEVSKLHYWKYVPLDDIIENEKDILYRNHNILHNEEYNLQSNFYNQTSYRYSVRNPVYNLQNSYYNPQNQFINHSAYNYAYNDVNFYRHENAYNDRNMNINFIDNCQNQHFPNVCKEPLPYFNNKSNEFKLVEDNNSKNSNNNKQKNTYKNKKRQKNNYSEVFEDIKSNEHVSETKIFKDNLYNYSKLDYLTKEGLSRPYDNQTKNEKITLFISGDKKEIFIEDNNKLHTVTKILDFLEKSESLHSSLQEQRKNLSEIKNIKLSDVVNGNNNDSYPILTDEKEEISKSESIGEKKIKNADLPNIIEPVTDKDHINSVALLNNDQSIKVENNFNIFTVSSEEEQLDCKGLYVKNEENNACSSEESPVTFKRSFTKKKKNQINRKNNKIKENQINQKL